MKEHKFDLGNEIYIVECKKHKWTKSNKVPNAKLTGWNEAMYYFLLSPKKFKKIFFILKSYNEKKNKTLAEYYIATYKHLIPYDVEFWEYDESTEKVEKKTI